MAAADGGHALLTRLRVGYNSHMAKKKTTRKSKPRRIADMSQSALSIVARVVGGKLMPTPKRRAKTVRKKKK
jgi:hypothetical protein